MWSPPCNPPSPHQVPTKYRPSTDQVEPIIIEKIVEVPVEVIREVEKIVEVPVYIEKQEPLIKREELKLPEEQNWTETNEEKNQELNDNIKRLIYKK